MLRRVRSAGSERQNQASLWQQNFQFLCQHFQKPGEAIGVFKEEVREGDRVIVLRLNLHQSLNFPLRVFFKN